MKTSRSQDATSTAQNFSRKTESAEVGSTIVGNGTTVLNAGNDVNLRQATVDAGAGLLSIHADRNVALSAGQSTQSAEEARSSKKSGLFFSKTTTTQSTSDETLTQGTNLSGGLVSITANGNITGEGVKINGDDGVLVHADGKLDLHEARDVRSESSSVSVKKIGMGIGGGALPLVVPINQAAQDAGTRSSDTAVATRITSKNGGVLLQGDGAALLRGVKIDAAGDLAIQGGAVSITGAENFASGSTEHFERNLNMGSESGWKDLADGVDARRTDTTARETMTLDRTVLGGANVSITSTGKDGKGGVLSMTGTTVSTPGTLTLSADKLILGTQSTQTDLQSASQGRDVVWQKAKGEGTSDQTTQYNQFNVGVLATPVNSLQIGLGGRDSVESLAKQPGMAWMNQIANDPKLAGKVDWAKVEEAHSQWDYKQQGLTPEGAVIVTAVASFFTAGTASAWGAAAGAAVGGGTTGVVVAGAVTAGVNALAGQVAVAVANNRGDLGAALHDLGSSENVRGLVTAIATGGVLGSLSLNLTGLPTEGTGAQKFMAQLGQNLQAGAAKAVLGTAINGGSRRTV